MKENNKIFNIGELVKILYPPMDGDLGIIVKQGENPAEGEMMLITNDEWLVHLIDGREIWLWTSWLANV